MGLTLQDGADCPLDAGMRPVAPTDQHTMIKASSRSSFCPTSSLRIPSPRPVAGCSLHVVTAVQRRPSGECHSVKIPTLDVRALVDEARRVSEASRATGVNPATCYSRLVRLC